MLKRALAGLGALCVLLPVLSSAAAAVSGGRWDMDARTAAWLAAVSFAGCLLLAAASLLLRRKRLLFVLGPLVVLQLSYLPVWLGQRYDTYGSAFAPLPMLLALLNGVRIARLLVLLALGAGGTWLALRRG